MLIQKIRKKKENNTLLFIMELSLAILLALVCGIIGMSNLLWESNNLYPESSNALAQMTKVLYLSKEISHGHFSQWFPYWYNGSTAAQYDAPFPLYFMVLVYCIAGNAVLTYKIYCAAVLAAGGLGIWVLCYKKVGRLCGLIGLVAYCLQPLLLSSLYREGLLTQGMFYAITPWLLLCALSCVKKPTRSNFIAVVILTLLMILTNVRISILISIILIIAMILLAIFKKVTIKNFIITINSLIFAILLAAFWLAAMVGSLGNINIFDNKTNIATIDICWFLPWGNAPFYFSTAVVLLSIFSIVCYFMSVLMKRINDNHKYYAFACILLTIVTITFPLGANLPGFYILQFASIAVPGIFFFTSAAAAASSAYTVYVLWNFQKTKWVLRLITFLIILFLCYDLNPYKNIYQSITSKTFNSVKTVAACKQNSFDKGRYDWYGNLDIPQEIFAFKNKINMSSGWSGEYTPQNQAYRNSQIALSINDYNYILKQAAFWNIRYLKLDNGYSELGAQLKEKLGFKQAGNSKNGKTVYISNQPSSYFITDNRNALVISNEIQGFSVQFPNIIQSDRNNIWDYSVKELLKYKLIYIIEPEIQTHTQKTKFQEIVIKLINAGVTIMIEPSASQNFDLFGIHAQDELISSSPSFVTTAKYLFTIEGISRGKSKELTNNSYLNTVRSLYGLDKVYAYFNYKHSNITNAVLGTKKVGNGEVIFVGAHLSQYLKAVYSHSKGLGAEIGKITENSNFIESVYSSIFNYYGVKNEYLPKSFNLITKQKWNYKGVSFRYQSNGAKKVTISITYTPNWNATIDRKQIEVGHCENLVTLNLPAGKHEVELHYGTTYYGKLGYLISAGGIFLLLMVIFSWNLIMKFVDIQARILRIYFQFDDIEMSPNSIENTIEEIDSTIEERAEMEIKNQNIGNENSEKEDSVYTIKETVNENGISIYIIDIDKYNE